MTIALLALLALALAWRIRAHAQAVRLVRRAIEQRQLILRDRMPQGKGNAWEGLIDVVNELIADARRLDHLRATQHSQLQATLDSIQEGVLIVDENNYVRLANPALHAIFPGAEKIVGQRLEGFLHSQAFGAYVTAARKGEKRPSEEFEFPQQGGSTWLEVSAAPVAPLLTAEEAAGTGTTGASAKRPEGAPAPWTLLVLHDITRQKHLEAVRKDFVANVSHELRTPLSVIKGYIETLVDDHQTMSPADRARFLTTVQRHSERLYGIVEDLLVLSRLESATPGLEREETRLAALLAAVSQDYCTRGFAAAGSDTEQSGAGAQLAAADPTRTSTDQQGLGPATHHLRISIPSAFPALSLDPLKMTQVFGNLLDNALKYTPAGSTVTIGAKVVGNEVEIAVADNGLGIAAADLPRLFERFYRVDKGRSRDTGGTGLGLSIVKHIVQLHGGRVTVESRQAPTTDPAGAGTTFTIWLPLE